MDDKKITQDFVNFNLPTKYIKKCSVINCNNKYLCKGYCRIHYENFVVRAVNKQRKCLVIDCEKKCHSYNKYCGMHKARLYKYGTIDGGVIKKGWSIRKKVYKKCIAPLCETDSNKGKIKKGLCNKHYIRWCKYEDYNKVLKRGRKSKT